MKQIRFMTSDDKATCRKMQRGGRMTEPNRERDDELDESHEPEDPEPDEQLKALARERADGNPTRTAAAPRMHVAPKLPGWTRFSTPLLLITILLLLTIGGWALGAVIYEHSVDPIAPEDIRYPLLRWSDDVGTSGGYSPESRMMPLAMLGAFPLAILLLLILLYLRKHRRLMLAHTTPPTSADTPLPSSAQTPPLP
jgi:hypothetical protein